jgi:hypothetical protein
VSYTERDELKDLESQQQIDDLIAVMSTTQGRRFVWRLLSEAGVYRTSFSCDVALMSFNEGKRNVGLELLNELVSNCHSSYLKMVEEANVDRTNATAKPRAASDY